jgi:hypothetical protein
VNATDWNAWVIGLGLEHVVAPAARLSGDGAFAWMVRGLHPATFERSPRLAAFGTPFGIPRLFVAEGGMGTVCVRHSRVLYNGLAVTFRSGQKLGAKNTVGLPLLEERFAIDAFDRAAARVLLDGPLGRVLLKLAGEGFLVGFYDEMFRVTGPVTDHGSFLRLSSAATELSRAAEEGFRGSAPPASLEHVRVAWGRAAARRDLDFDPAHFFLRGTFGGILVEVALRSQGGLTYTEVAAQHQLPLPIQFSLRLHEDMIAGRITEEETELQIGDAVFDRRFVVRSKNANEASPLRDLGLRGQLGSLASSLASFYLGPEGVIAVRTWAVADERELVDLVDRVISLVQRFSADTSGPGEHLGPYR